MKVNIMNMELEKKIIEFVTIIAGSNLRKPVTLETEIFESKLVDSFGLLQLIADIEHEFNVNVSTEDMTMENFSTISGIAELIKRYQLK
jgi:acyl carrier protein